MFIVSLGTGAVNRPYEYKRARNWGQIGWVKPVIDIMMSGASATTSYHLKKIFSAINRSDQYVRIQPKDLGDASSELDNATPGNIAALVALGHRTAEEYNDQINHIADVLLELDDDLVKFA